MSAGFQGYGISWPQGTTQLAVELACYANPKKHPSGLSPENHLRRAMFIVWPPGHAGTVFQWNEWVELLVMAWCRYRIIAVIGHMRASKTFTLAHIALLDYMAGLGSTATSFTTTKFGALKDRLWGDMKKAIDSSPLRDYLLETFKLTDTTNELRLSIRAKGKISDDKNVIQGVATDSADRSAGKLRGLHADRRRIIVDEAQDVAEAVYMAFANAMSAPDFKGVLLSNPVEKNSVFGEWCEPVGGWESVSDSDLWWETRKGGVCLHFDGLRNPNLRAGKALFPWLLTPDGVNDIRAKFGEDSLEWWMYVRGFFPPDGIVARVWNTQAVERARRVEDFDYAPEAVASLDPAFEHDECILVLGKLGTLRGGNPCCVATEAISIKTRVGAGFPEKERQVADQVMAICKERGVRPENFIMDTTGNDRSVYAILKSEWGGGVHWLDYGGKATGRPLRFNDPKAANELVKWFVAELWFRAAYLARDGLLCGLDALGEKGRADLAARRYKVVKGDDGDVMVVESKREMKARLGRSPDRGDAYCQLGELMARKGLLKGVGGKGGADGGGVGSGGIAGDWKKGRERCREWWRGRETWGAAGAL